MSDATLPRKTLGARPIEQVRHSPTCSRNARLTFSASSRATGTWRSVPIRRQAISVDRADLLDRQTGVDRLENALVVVGIEPVVGLHRDDRRAEPPRIPYK